MKTSLRSFAESESLASFAFKENPFVNFMFDCYKDSQTKVRATNESELMPIDTHPEFAFPRGHDSTRPAFR